MKMFWKNKAAAKRKTTASRCLAVAQISNLLYRRFATCTTPIRTHTRALMAGFCFISALFPPAMADAANTNVNLSGFQFVPRDVTVNVGDTVTWVNQDFTFHTTTSGTNRVPSGLWDQALPSRGDSFSFTFNVAPGYYGYYCTPHVFSFNMAGSITVLPPPNNAPTVSIQTPTNGAVFLPGTTISIQASAADSDNGGFISRVDFSVNGTFLSSASSQPYTAALTNAAEGNYTISAIAVDNQGAASAPAIANIAVILPTESPKIGLQPQSQTVNAGSNATFSVTAVGVPAPDYQWNFESAPIAGATSNVLIIVNAQKSDEGIYTVIVSNRAGFVVSDPATLTVTNVPPQVVITSPRNATGFPLGTSVRVVVQANDTDGAVSEVKLFLNSNLIATFINPPFETNLAGLTDADYVLTVQATDNGGAVSTSAPVHFRIFDDTTRPTIAITNSPRNFAELTNSTVMVEGAARDDKQVEQVQFQVNGGTFTNGAGTTMWRASVPLLPGNNEVRFRSVDRATNFSAVATRYFTYLVPAVLTLRTNGMGSVTTSFRNQPPYVGKVYSLTARPAAGFIFAGWERSGITNRAPLNQTNGPVLNFIMEPDLELVANFAPNPFVDAAGTYAGLFLDTNTFRLDGSGFFTLRLDKQGRFSGKLAMNGRRYPFRGYFNGLREALAPVIRPGLPPTVLRFQLDTNGAAQITGSATNAVATNVLVATNLLAHRTVGAARDPAAPQAGTRLFVLQNSDHAMGKAAISRSGTVRLTGTFNGRKFAVASAMGRDDDDGYVVPFYLAPGGSEAIIGWIKVGTDPQDVSGTLFWLKPGERGLEAELQVIPAP
jgi:plastocyanin